MISCTNVNISCGLYALGGETQYKTAEVYFKDLASVFFDKEGKGKRPAQSMYLPLLSDHSVFIWSHQPSKYSIGHDIKKYIEDKGLGEVTVSGSGLNPVHKSKICVWTWIRNNEAFEKHCKELLCPILTTPPTVASTKCQVSEASPTVQASGFAS